MILPGHLAASLLCHRHLRVDLRLALVAGVLPDVVDKLAYYVFHLVPSSRLPMHTLLAWLASTAVVALLALALSTSLARTRERACPRPRSSRGPSGAGVRSISSFSLAYAAHLLCDSPLLGGKLPFLWPFRAYHFTSPRLPLGFLFGLDAWPIQMLIAELLLVSLTLYLEWRRARALSARRAALTAHHPEAERRSPYDGLA